MTRPVIRKPALVAFCVAVAVAVALGATAPRSLAVGSSTSRATTTPSLTRSFPLGHHRLQRASTTRAGSTTITQPSQPQPQPARQLRPAAVVSSTTWILIVIGAIVLTALISCLLQRRLMTRPARRADEPEAVSATGPGDEVAPASGAGAEDEVAPALGAGPGDEVAPAPGTGPEDEVAPASGAGAEDELAQADAPIPADEPHEAPAPSAAGDLGHESAPHPAPELGQVKFILYQDNGGGYYWTIVDGDGGVLARSTGFQSYPEANFAADIVSSAAGNATFEDRSGTSPPPRPLAPRKNATPQDRPEPSPDQRGSADREERGRRARSERLWPAGPPGPTGRRRR